MAFSVDDAWDNGPEVTRAGTAAFGLYCRCGAWCARNLQDGFVPSEIAAAYGTPEWAARLVSAGLWETVEGGYRMPHYLDRNESAEQVRRRRKADATRKARWRRNNKQTERSRRDSTPSPGRSHGGNRGQTNPADEDQAGQVPTDLRHPYEATSFGECGECGLPASNRRHQEPA